MYSMMLRHTEAASYVFLNVKRREHDKKVKKNEIFCCALQHLTSEAFFFIIIALERKMA